MYKIYYNANPNMPKQLSKEVYRYLKDNGKQQIERELQITNHIGRREELTQCDYVEFEEMGAAVSFLRNCSYPITKEYEITGYHFEEENIELLANKFDSLN